MNSEPSLWYIVHSDKNWPGGKKLVGLKVRSRELLLELPDVLNQIAEALGRSQSVARYPVDYARPEA